jgi:hypothetical protein
MPLRGADIPSLPFARAEQEPTLKPPETFPAPSGLNCLAANNLRACYVSIHRVFLEEFAWLKNGLAFIVSFLIEE